MANGDGGFYVKNTFIEFPDEDEFMVDGCDGRRRQNTDSLLVGLRNATEDDEPVSFAGAYRHRWAPLDSESEVLDPSNLSAHGEKPDWRGVDQASKVLISKPLCDQTVSESTGAAASRQHTQDEPEPTPRDVATLTPVVAEGKHAGILGKTTVMLRNVPAKFTQRKLIKYIDGAGFLGRYDFIYLPMDQRSRANRGFAFCNLLCPDTALQFFEAFHGNRFGGGSDCDDDAQPHEPPLQVVAAAIQGFEDNATHYVEARASQRGRHSHSRPLLLRPLPPHLASQSGAAFVDQQIGPIATGFGAEGPPSQGLEPQVGGDSKAHPSRTGRSRAGTTSAHVAAVPSQPRGCASAQPRFCPYCGMPKQAEFLFCAFCGRPKAPEE